MATVTIVFYRTGKFANGKIPICLRLTIDRISKYYPLGTTFKCTEEQWDNDNRKFKKGFPNYKKANRNLHGKLSDAESIIIDLEHENIEITFDEFRKRLIKKDKKIYVLKYFDELIKRLKNSGHIGNALVYSTCKRSLETFFGRDFEIHELTQKKLILYVEYCQTKKLKPNSISNYLRTLRAVCKRAELEEKVDYETFKHFSLKAYKNETKKRAISKADMLKIINYQANENTSIFDSVKYFVFSYLTWGINFADLAKLTKKNIHESDGTKFLAYYRSKGGKLYDVPLNKMALEILNYYLEKYPVGNYLFPVLDEDIHNTPEKIKTRIKTALKKMNDDLKAVATDIGIKENISSYVARHTFATVLKKQGEDISMISEMMGHADPATTQIYLKSFDSSEKLEASKKLTD